VIFAIISSINMVVFGVMYDKHPEWSQTNVNSMCLDPAVANGTAAPSWCCSLSVTSPGSESCTPGKSIENAVAVAGAVCALLMTVAATPIVPCVKNLTGILWHYGFVGVYGIAFFVGYHSRCSCDVLYSLAVYTTGIHMALCGCMACFNFCDGCRDEADREVDERVKRFNSRGILPESQL